MMVESHQSSAAPPSLGVAKVKKPGILPKGCIISTDKTKFTGGYCKNFSYQIDIPKLVKKDFTAEALGLDKLSWKKKIKQSPDKVHLYMDSNNFSTAEIFAISNIGKRVNELSVFSVIPSKYITKYKHGSEEYKRMVLYKPKEIKLKVSVLDRIKQYPFKK